MLLQLVEVCAVEVYSEYYNTASIQQEIYNFRGFVYTHTHIYIFNTSTTVQQQVRVSSKVHYCVVVQVVRVEQHCRAAQASSTGLG